MNIITIKAFFAFVLVLLCSACGITAGSLNKDPGYASLDFPHFWQAEKEIGISIGPALMGIARNFIPEDEDVFHLIQNIRGVHLRVYSVADNSDVINQHIDINADELSVLGWERIITVRENNEYTVIMVRLEGDLLQGLVVLTNDSTEAVFVNVIGSIEPGSLQPLLTQVYEDMPEVTTPL